MSPKIHPLDETKADGEKFREDRRVVVFHVMPKRTARECCRSYVDIASGEVNSASKLKQVPSTQ